MTSGSPITFMTRLCCRPSLYCQSYSKDLNMKDYPRPTYQIAMAAGRDAANRSAVRAGRTSWNDDDLATALTVFDRRYRLADPGYADMMDTSRKAERD